MKKPTVSRKFPPAKRRMIVGWLDTVLRATLQAADDEGLEVLSWPRSISPMTAKEIRKDKRFGGGHGVYLSETETIRLNASMPWMGLILNLFHELWHHVDHGATEEEINFKIVPYLYECATAERLDPGDWEEWRGYSWRGVKKKNSRTRR